MKSFRSGIGNYDANAHVYHYTSAETALRHILPAGKLRIGPLTTVNDPRESRMLGFTYLPKGMLRASLLSGESLEFHIKNLDKRDITDRASAPLTAQIKVVCFARDTASPATTVQGYYRGYTRPSMWAHYGGSHTGICLVFDRDQLVADAHRDLGALGHLAYGNMRYPANRIALRDQLAMNLDLDEISRVGLEQSLAWKFRDYHAELCLKKHPDWRMEEEWRILLFSSGKAFRFIDVSRSLRGIVLGSDFDLAKWQPELEQMHSRIGLEFDKVGIHQLTGRGFGSPQFLPAAKRT